MWSMYDIVCTRSFYRSSLYWTIYKPQILNKTHETWNVNLRIFHRLFKIDHGYRANLFLNDAKSHSELKIVLPHASKTYEKLFSAFWMTTQSRLVSSRIRKMGWVSMRSTLLSFSRKKMRLLYMKSGYLYGNLLPLAFI